MEIYKKVKIFLGDMAETDGAQAITDPGLKKIVDACKIFQDFLNESENNIRKLSDLDRRRGARMAANNFICKAWSGLAANISAICTESKTRFTERGRLW